MTRSTAATLNDLNRRFYAEQAVSFSSTRRGSWAGWSRALEIAGITHMPSTVVDVACGNMRFESYLAERFPNEPLNAIGVDNCPDLVAAERKACVVKGFSSDVSSQVHVGAPLVAPGRLQDASADNGPQVHVGAEPAQPGGYPLHAVLSRVAAFCNPAGGPGSAPTFTCESSTDGISGDVILSGARSAESKNLVGENAGSQVPASFLNRDLVDLLLNNCPLDFPAGALVVCFGFMHHVPGATNRRRMLAELLASVAPGGTLVASFWQFMAAPGIAAQANELTEPSLAALGLALNDVELGDFILGWQNLPTARRYCHNFTLDEVRSLAHDALEDVGSPADFTLTFFEADGRNNRLNCYLVASRR